VTRFPPFCGYIGSPICPFRCSLFIWRSQRVYQDISSPLSASMTLSPPSAPWSSSLGPLPSSNYSWASFCLFFFQTFFLPFSVKNGSPWCANSRLFRSYPTVSAVITPAPHLLSRKPLRNRISLLATHGVLFPNSRLRFINVFERDQAPFSRFPRSQPLLFMGLPLPLRSRYFSSLGCGPIIRGKHGPPFLLSFSF